MEALTRIVDSETGGTLNSGAKSAALSIFEGTKQRFFAQLLLSMKLPSLEAHDQESVIHIGFGRRPVLTRAAN
jgi:hypothetical protein